MLDVGHYINQFFAGIGGEQSANLPPERRDGPVGPGRALETLLNDSGAVVSTLLGGGSFFSERAEEAHAAVRTWMEEVRPDLVIAGPAFAAGRYGVACAEVCRQAAELGVPAVTGMHPENPGLLGYKKAFVIPTSDSATDMARALSVMFPLGHKLASGEPIGPAEVEGYLPRGVRRPGRRTEIGAERAMAMLLAKLTGQPFRTEIPVDQDEPVPPARPAPAGRAGKIPAPQTGS